MRVRAILVVDTELPVRERAEIGAGGMLGHRAL
jgi:hypothetical protein